VTYFIAVRLVLINRISLQHSRPVDYVQEPNAEPASSRRNLLGETGMSPVVGLLKGNPRCEPLSSASRALWPRGSAFAARASMGAPSPRCTWWRPRYAQKIWSGPVLPPPKFPGVAMESCLAQYTCVLGSGKDEDERRGAGGGASRFELGTRNSPLPTEGIPHTTDHSNSNTQHPRPTPRAFGLADHAHLLASWWLVVLGFN
jgi:hypothetical protein